jgi:ferritin-like metal-binding protein YciE
MATTVDEQLAIYLTDAHAIELQALEQMKRAPAIADDQELAEAFSDHLEETERHERFVRSRLEAMSWSPVFHKDVAGKATGIGFALFARAQPDSPGKLVAHAYSYEHMELAAYDLLGRLARRADDSETELMAHMIEQDERKMAERLEQSFDRAVDASLRELGADERPDQQLNRYLADAHAIERQASQLLQKGPKLAGAAELAAAFKDHLEETEAHSKLIEQRLKARDSSPSMLKDAALRLGGLNLGMFFKAQVDTPAKLAGFAYAFEHLEIAAYELLKRVAARAGDEETISAAEKILLQERNAAGRVHSLFDYALDASLHEAGVTA